MSPEQRLALAAYGAAMRLLLPAMLARYWWRGRREPGYRAHLGERLGLAPVLEPGAVWLHAVSLGETRACGALVEALRARLPGVRFLFTHGTATGREAGRALMRPGDAQCWLPLDTPGAVRRFLARTRPAIGLLMETEIWPHLLRAARAAGLPMVLANARLSERSARRGASLAALMRPAAEAVAEVLAQTEDDARRLRATGAGRVVVCGNLKYDVQPSAAQIGQGRGWRAALGRPVVLAAVTRDGEEQALLRAWSGLAPEGRPLLLVVPRHPQRFDEVAGLLARAGLRLARRSAWGGQPRAQDLGADAWLGDSLGEMPMYYGCADVALLGGSFLPFGGQNLIEAAACGCPVVMGPSTFNFAEAAQLAERAGAAWREPDMALGLRRALEVVASGERREAGERAQAFAGMHRGAAARMAEHVAALLEGPARAGRALT